MPDELRAQWEQAPALLARMGWTVASAGELEADDLMYSHAREEAEAGGEALIVSGDRDMYAAVDERVGILELRGKAPPARIDAREVRRRYGIDPPLVPDFIALRGDPSDGLPGAPGIGAKTAAVLLRGYGSLEALLGAAQAAGGERAELASVAACATTAPEELRARTAAILRESAALLSTFKQVATLQRIDVARPADRPTDFAAGASVAREMGMRRLAERLEKLSGATA
jgi:DNA polymerase-1